MEKRQLQKDSAAESSRGNAEDEDNESWVELESLASLDSTGDVQPPETTPLEKEYAESASSAADSPDAADLYLNQNRQTPLAPRKLDLDELKNQSAAETPPPKKAPRWWRIVKTVYAKVVESTFRLVQRARPIVKRVLYPNEKPGKIARWCMSNERWSLVICGGAVVVLIACAGMITQSSTLKKGLCWKQA